jgi:hypothetical protein
VATPNYGYEKRQKELAKKRKKEDKLKRKSEGKPEDDTDGDQTPDTPADTDNAGDTVNSGSASATNGHGGGNGAD